jgi:hypothetical protein
LLPNARTSAALSVRAGVQVRARGDQAVDLFNSILVSREM